MFKYLSSEDANANERTIKYSVSQSIEVHLETSPLTPLLVKERGKNQTVPQLL